MAATDALGVVAALAAVAVAWVVLGGGSRPESNNPVNRTGPVVGGTPVSWPVEGSGGTYSGFDVLRRVGPVGSGNVGGVV